MKITATWPDVLSDLAFNRRHWRGMGLEQVVLHKTRPMSSDSQTLPQENFTRARSDLFRARLTYHTDQGGTTFGLDCGRTIISIINNLFRPGDRESGDLSVEILWWL